jgi:hypothetical protein
MNPRAEAFLGTDMPDHNHESKLPKLLHMNSISFVKQNAKECLLADIKSVQADVVLITESWFTDCSLASILK